MQRRHHQADRPVSAELRAILAKPCLESIRMGGRSRAPGEHGSINWGSDIPNSCRGPQRSVVPRQMTHAAIPSSGQSAGAPMPTVGAAHLRPAPGAARRTRPSRAAARARARRGRPAPSWGTSATSTPWTPRACRPCPERRDRAPAFSTPPLLGHSPSPSPASSSGSGWVVSAFARGRG